MRSELLRLLRGTNPTVTPQIGWVNEPESSRDVTKRIERSPGLWAGIKKEWLDAYFNQRVIKNKSCKQAVTHLDEWVAEAYMEIDYSTVTKEDFDREVKKFALYNLMVSIGGLEPVEDEEEV
jgi:hypothetical protein